MERETESGLTDEVQERIVRLVATSPAGHNLLLIGGFRYRFLDRSARTSRDIDYHWAGDLEEKQKELRTLLERRLLPSLKRDLDYDGQVELQHGPAADSPAVKAVIVALWKTSVPHSRVEIPVEITRVPNLDRTEIRTVHGAIYPTLSDADQIESKVVAVFARRVLQYRDIVDIFLFAGQLMPESRERLAGKFASVGITRDDVALRLDDLDRHAAHHAKQVQMILDTQLDREAVGNLNAAGGGRLVLEKVLATLRANT